MILTEQIIRQASQASGISEEDLRAFFAEGNERTYQQNEWLFHESTPPPPARWSKDGSAQSRAAPMCGRWKPDPSRFRLRRRAK